MLGALFTYYEVKQLVVPTLREQGYEYLMTISEVLTVFFVYHCIKIAITDPGVILRHSQYEDMKIEVTEEELKKR